MLEILTHTPTLAQAAFAAVGAIPTAASYAARNRLFPSLRERPGGINLGREIETRGGPHGRPHRRRDARRMGRVRHAVEAGRVKAFGRELRLDLGDAVTHLQVVAPTNQGKTTVLKALAVQNLKQGLTVFVLETGGDFATELIPYAHAYGRPVFVFDPSAEDTWKWNTLEGRPEKVAGRAASTLKALGDSSEDFFKVQNYTMLRAVVLATHAWASKTGGIPTLAVAKKIATDDTFRREALEVTGGEATGRGKRSRGTVNNKFLPHEARDFWQDEFYGSMSDKERGEFVAGMKGALNMLLGDERVADAVCPTGEESERELLLKEALDSGGLVVMRCSPSAAPGTDGETALDLDTAQALSVWCMEAFKQIVLQRDPDSSHPVIAYFDEVHNTLGQDMHAAAKAFSHWITMARHHNVGCVFSYQGYEMIPHELRVIFDGNLKNKLITGGLSHKDALEAQKLLGDDADKVNSIRQSRGVFPFSTPPVPASISTSEQDLYRFSVDEIRSLPRGQWIYSGTVQGQLLYPTLMQANLAPTVREVEEELQSQARRAKTVRDRKARIQARKEHRALRRDRSREGSST